MSLFKALKSKFCKHDFELIYASKSPIFAVEDALTAVVACKKCGLQIDVALHDLSETEEISYRFPVVEKLLYEKGVLERKNGKIIVRLGKLRYELKDTPFEVDVKLATKRRKEFELNDSRLDCLCESEFPK